MMQNKVDKYPSIDALKGIGALILAFAYHYKHFGQTFPLANFFLFSDNYGYLLVDLFFVLSGFGIASGYQHKIQSKECSISFYIRRMLHILLTMVMLQVSTMIRHGLG